MFVFGLRTEEVEAMRTAGYQPQAFAERSPALKAVLDAIADGTFSYNEPDRYKGLVQHLLNRDPYFLLADFDSYVAMQGEVDGVFANRTAWAERALRNIAGMGIFSVDRTIGEYIDKVWTAPRH